MVKIISYMIKCSKKLLRTDGKLSIPPMRKSKKPLIQAPTLDDVEAGETDSAPSSSARSRC